MAVHPLIKKFEQQLLIAMNDYLRKKGFLTNGHGEELYTCGNSASSIRVSLRGEYQKNILLTYLGCPTNAQPCVSGYIDLRLKKQDEDCFKKERFFFHVCANKYTVKMDMEGVTLTEVEFFIRQGSRYF